MPCLGCFKHEGDQRKPLSVVHEDTKPHIKVAEKRSHLKVMGELSEATYGLAVEGNENRPYEAQDFFAFKEILGSGVMSVVFRAYFKPTGKPYAVKFVPNFKQLRSYMARELTILKISHGCRYTVHYHSHFRVRENMYFVIELCEGGTMEELLGSKSLMPPNLGRIYLKELSTALMFLHNAKYVHRDLHLANCLLTSTAHIRLTDFGLCRKVGDPSGEMMTMCGRAAIRAPEMYLDRLCGFGLDWWSLGVIMYRFITGYYPFQTEKLIQGFQSVTKLKEKYPDWLFDDPHSTDMCQRLLEKDPKHRIGYYSELQIKAHPYFSSLQWDEEENIQNIIEQDLQKNPRMYLPVYQKLYQILSVQCQHVCDEKDSICGSDMSYGRKVVRDLRLRGVTPSIKDLHDLPVHSKSRSKFKTTFLISDTIV